MTPHWIVMPFLNCWPMTAQALTDMLGQTGLPAPPQVLAIDTGSTMAVREAIDAWAEREPRLHVWHWRPGLPSLSATWNLALQFVWSQGGQEALVVNNDVRLHPSTFERLMGMQQFYRAHFVSAVGRREGDMDWPQYFAQSYVVPQGSELGGPDFSCFVITKEAHSKYPFDEGFQPAYCEDLDTHRRYILGGDSERIFSVNLPYLHFASATINQDPLKVAEWGRRIEQSRAYYRRKWGGPVNEERWTIPFDAETDQDHVTTPELHRATQALPLSGLPDNGVSTITGFEDWRQPRDASPQTPDRPDTRPPL